MALCCAFLLRASEPNAPPTSPSTRPTRAPLHCCLQVLSEVQGSAGVATLNRPRALNALTTGMVEALFDVYQRWDTDPGIACIVLKVKRGQVYCCLMPISAGMPTPASPALC